jgi:protein ImuA
MACASSSPLSERFGDAVWRADALGHNASATVLTGHAALDAQLPGGGWPVGALSEILQAYTGQHEWRLLLPALTKGVGPVVLVGAPHLPFGPGLAAQGLDARRLLWVRSDTPAQRLWASEQALRCAEVLAVLAWLPQVRAEQLRRLQMAAQTHGKLLFVMRPAPAQAESSPALLRLLVTGPPRDAPVDALSVQVIKRRGPPLAQALVLLARHARLAALLALCEGPGAGIHVSTLSAGGPHALDRLAAAA